MMLSFVFAVMLLVCLVVLLWPLSRASLIGPTRQDYDVAIYRDQLVEIERDAVRGLLPPEQLAIHRTEIQRRVLATAVLPETKATTFGVRWISVMALLFVTLGSVTVYGYLGSPQLPSAPFAERRFDATNDMGDFQQNIMIRRMVERLASRLQASPDDLEGWQRLAQAYRVLGESRKAEQAERRVESLKIKKAKP